MIDLWLYHWRMGRIVESLYRQAMFERIVGREAMQRQRSDLAFVRGEQWSTDDMMILRRRAF
jgi:hypothetical protein